MTKTTSKKYAAPADYMDLVRKFPIRPLVSEAEYKAAMQAIKPLIGRDDLTEGEDAYLDAVSYFIEVYEDEHHYLDLPKSPPVEMLKALMEHRQMSVSDLGEVIGSRPMASMIVNGQRGISKANIMRLAQYFHVEPAIFMRSAPRSSESGRAAGRRVK